MTWNRTEITQYEKKEKIGKKKSIRDLRDYKTRSNTCVIGVPEEKEGRD